MYSMKSSSSSACEEKSWWCASKLATEAVVADGVRAAYWVDTGTKAHLRWVRPEPEERLVAALARLQAGGGLELGEGSRYVGSFRAHGLVVPVWDLDRERHAKEWAAPAGAFAKRLDEALAAGGTSFDALYVNVNGESGYFDRSLAVYGQAGRPCPRCGALVRRDSFMNRSSYTCPVCQPKPRNAHY